jgi:putative membrane protein
MGMMGWGGLDMLIWSLPMLLVWAGAIVAAVLAVRWLWGSSRSAPGAERDDAALEILRRRYARGEIDREEFEAKKRDLVA